ncbi:MAG: DUF4097 family beta strand repeat-containing protein [Bacillota bacterium]
MQEERMAILKLIQEGTVTAQEGVELLKALGQPAKEGGPQAGWGAQAPPRQESDRDRGARPRSILEDVIDGFGGINLRFGLFGETYKFEEQHEGRFEPVEGQPVTIQLNTSNGRLVLKGWDRPDYQVRVIKSLRGPGEEEARRRAQEMVRFTATPTGLILESRISGWNNSGVAAELSLPTSHLYRLDLRTANGRIELEGLRAEAIEAQTSNGRVVCERSTGGRFRLRTSNGRIVANCSARDFDADTSNGSITVVPFGALDGESRFQLRTSNGSIRIRPDEQADSGYDIDASTSMGHIELELPNLEYSVHERQVGHRRSKARTTGFDGKARRIYLSARTSNGSVVVSRSV